jgi:hypothetical protein
MSLDLLVLLVAVLNIARLEEGFTVEEVAAKLVGGILPLVAFNSTSIPLCLVGACSSSALVATPGPFLVCPAVTATDQTP